MLINCRYNEFRALLITGSIFFVFFLYAIIVSLVDQQFHTSIYFPSYAPLTIFGAGVSIFLAFRINSGYARWWEARQIWGVLVNDSRNFGVLITTALTQHGLKEVTIAEKQFQKEIIYNLIGYMNALRLHLRNQGKNEWDIEIWDRSINGMALFSADDRQLLMNKKHCPAQIIHLMGKKISLFFTGMDYRYLRIMDALLLLNHTLGMSERIKNTVFPWGYAYYTHRVVWIFGLLLPLAMIKGVDWPNIFFSALLTTVFITAEQVARNLDNPFENSFNDTPMSALCRNVEIDLLQYLNEQELPEAIKPVNGILY